MTFHDASDDDQVLVEALIGRPLAGRFAVVGGTSGLGRKLAEAIIDVAQQRGYTAMYLDTMPQSMQAAYRLYCAMGFIPVQRYNQNPVLRQSDALEIAFLRRGL